MAKVKFLRLLWGDMNYEKIFRDNLLRLMDERDLNKTELAELAGISVSFVSDITTGKAGNPSLKVMGAIARALRIPLPLLLYANPGDMWATWYAIPQLQADFYYLQINPLDHPKLLGLDSEHTRDLTGRLMRIKGHVFKGNAAINGLVASAFHNLATRDENLRRCAMAQIVSFLHLLCDIARDPWIPTVTPFVADVMNRIGGQLTEDISLKALAQDFGYSLSHFMTKFRAEAGITPMHYINREKIELAKAFLSKGMSVTETALALSFNYSNYFSSVFQRFTSYMPSEYQRKVRKV